MKYILLLLFLCSLSSINIVLAQDTPSNNRALLLDGMDNNVRIGMDIIKAPWTIEAWIKGDSIWKKQEVIIGGGEYSNLNICDNLPLEVRNGYLHNEKTHLWSPEILNNKWHYVAISCNGSKTYLYLDDKIVDSSLSAYSILPGTLGVHTGSSTTFKGTIDEVRIWRSYINPTTIRSWKNKPVTPSHPSFNTLVGYYNFDDEMEDVGINWVGEGGQAYHLRVGRNNYKGKAPLAYTVLNNNRNFFYRDMNQRLFNAIVINNELDVNRGAKDAQVLKLRIAINGTENPMSFSQLKLDLNKLVNLSDLDKIHVYYTGKTARSQERLELFGPGQKPSRNMLFNAEKEDFHLSPGINYFLVTADISDEALIGNAIRISIPSFKLGGHTYRPRNSADQIPQQITDNSKNNPQLLKVLQWNIWHGGRHVGLDGVTRVIDLIKSSQADIITMQEAYGSQQRIKDSLKYFMATASLEDNLALFSRYPIIDIKTKFNKSRSNPSMVILPTNQRVLVNSCWLRYATDPNYGAIYANTGMDPEEWISADSIKGLIDIENIINKDTKPYVDDYDDVLSIIGGDFNSGSHLDWTNKAAKFHYGYGPVNFPVSRYLLSKGYKDSFREINPDEIDRPEGTWAVIYGYSRFFRIDYLYYKGKRIKAISSKIIKTSPEIDDVWASDHAALMTTFELL